MATDPSNSTALGSIRLTNENAVSLPTPTRALQYRRTAANQTGVFERVAYFVRTDPQGM